MSDEIHGDRGKSFAEMLEESIKTLNTGDKVTGIVTAITPTEIQVDLGAKHAGYIPLSELSDDPSAKPEDVVKVGDEIETYVVPRQRPWRAMVKLSKKRLDMVKGWEDIEAAKENKTVMEGIVTEDNKGGVVVSVKGVRVFVPASQTGLPRETPMIRAAEAEGPPASSPRSTVPAAAWWAPSAASAVPSAPPGR